MKERPGYTQSSVSVRTWQDVRINLTNYRNRKVMVTSVVANANPMP